MPILRVLGVSFGAGGAAAGVFAAGVGARGAVFGPPFAFAAGESAALPPPLGVFSVGSGALFGVAADLGATLAVFSLLGAFFFPELFEAFPAAAALFESLVAGSFLAGDLSPSAPLPMPAVVPESLFFGSIDSRAFHSRFFWLSADREKPPTALWEVVQ